MAHYSEEELKLLRLKSYGENVLISKDARIYNPQKVSVGNDVRIDDFCIISGEVCIGNNVHLAPGCQLAAGGAKIILKDFSGLAFNVIVTASSDDYSGNSLTNPTVPEQFKKTKQVGDVVLNKHVIVGASSVILPSVEIGEGASVGALSLVSKSIEPWGVYVGSPLRKIKDRSKKPLELEKEYRENYL